MICQQHQPNHGPDQAQREHHRSTVDKIKTLPTPVGVVLLGVGVAGILLPGPIGTPFFLAGGLALAPQVFGKVDRCVEEQFPEFHRMGMEAVERFLTDMEKRYPSDSQKT